MFFFVIFAIKKRKKTFFICLTLALFRVVFGVYNTVSHHAICMFKSRVIALVDYADPTRRGLISFFGLVYSGRNRL